MNMVQKDKIFADSDSCEKLRHDVRWFRNKNGHYPVLVFTKQIFIDFVDLYARWYLGDGQEINGITIKINENEIESFKNEMINEKYLLVDGVRIKIEFSDD